MQVKLQIIHHNRYECRDRPYDEYSVMVYDQRRHSVQQWPPKLLIGDILRNDLGIVNLCNIQIGIVWTLMSFDPPTVGIFFFDQMESVMFKLHYS